MSGYGICRWTCGECGDTYEHDGIVGDLKVDRWAREHKEQHRVEKMSLQEQADYTSARLGAKISAMESA
jgi:hypothetical protein